MAVTDKAIPTSPIDPVDFMETAPGMVTHWRGLTKREYFATHVLAGLLANQGDCAAGRELAADAVHIADHLIGALND